MNVPPSPAGAERGHAYFVTCTQRRNTHTENSPGVTDPPAWSPPVTTAYATGARDFPKPYKWRFHKGRGGAGPSSRGTPRDLGTGKCFPFPGSLGMTSAFLKQLRRPKVIHHVGRLVVIPRRDGTHTLWTLAFLAVGLELIGLRKKPCRPSNRGCRGARAEEAGMDAALVAAWKGLCQQLAPAFTAPTLVTFPHPASGLGAVPVAAGRHEPGADGRRPPPGPRGQALDPPRAVLPPGRLVAGRGVAAAAGPRRPAAAGRLRRAGRGPGGRRPGGVPEHRRHHRRPVRRARRLRRVLRRVLRGRAGRQRDARCATGRTTGWSGA